MFYLKLLLSSFSNTQNSHMYEMKNFGTKGSLGVGDQINLIAGIGFLIVSFMLVVMLTVTLVSSVPWMFAFGKKVKGTENIF
jgi:hypothetical protein